MDATGSREELLGPADLRSDLIRISERDPADLPEDPRLLEDLDLDSFALGEMVVLLEDRYGFTGKRADLLVRDWSETTVTRLFEECCRP